MKAPAWGTNRVGGPNPRSSLANRNASAGSFFYVLAHRLTARECKVVVGLREQNDRVAQRAVARGDAVLRGLGVPPAHQPQRAAYHQHRRRLGSWFFNAKKEGGGKCSALRVHCVGTFQLAKSPP